MNDINESKNKKSYKLTESQLRKIVAESVKKALDVPKEQTADYQFKMMVNSINSKIKYFKDLPQIYPYAVDDALRISKDLVKALTDYKEAILHYNPNARKLNPDGTTNISYFDKEYRQFK